MKSIHLIIFLLFSMLALSSCSKDDNAPVITITAPAEGAILEKGKTYPVQGTITDDVELAEIVAGGVKIMTFDSKTKHTLVNLNLPIPANAPTGNSTFTVTATDKEGNVGTKTVNFKIQ